ncbi:MAG: nicotinamide mononucleotide transporter [Bacteroidetes bacterium]|nr:nicotinamide mononucleotide transporter [Bacteroidota bacterium]
MFAKNYVISFLDSIQLQVANTSALEWFAFFFGVVQVLLALKNKVLNFYAGIVSVLLYIIVFYQAGLFAESLLNLYYLIISIAGILFWKGVTPLPISKTSFHDWIKITILFVLLGTFLYFILSRFTESVVPFADSLVATFAWIGSWMLVKRKLENWVLLNVSSILAIPLLIYKGLELTALLTVIYFVVAIFGYFTWKREFMAGEKTFQNS